MRWTAAVSFASLLLAACASLLGAPLAPAAASPSLDQAFTVKPGETVSVGPGPVLVSFERVTSDDRCPRDARCIRAGEAVVRVLVTLPGKSREQVEVRTAPDRESATVGGYVLKLAALEPVPLASKPTPASDYRATFVLSAR